VWNLPIQTVSSVGGFLDLCSAAPLIGRFEFCGTLPALRLLPDEKSSRRAGASVDISAAGQHFACVAGRRRHGPPIDQVTTHIPRRGAVPVYNAGATRYPDKEAKEHGFD
jgi:hypothetical protein